MASAAASVALRTIELPVATSEISSVAAAPVALNLIPPAVDTISIESTALSVD
jgi:hypothetical protein